VGRYEALGMTKEAKIASLACAADFFLNVDGYGVAIEYFKKGGRKDISDLVFVGLFGMIDPPKENIKEAIEKCETAGIRVLMLTGDHKTTAVAVAKEIGLLTKDIHEESKVVTEADLEGLSDKDFDDVVSRAVIFARVTPETKLKVAKTLQNDGNIVAMTGDGINDAPALKQANIGVSMGIAGTDVAKEASEIILTDDNFASVVNAIAEGRVVFSNVKKTSFYLITTNVAEAATIITGSKRISSGIISEANGHTPRNDGTDDMLFN